MRRAVPRPSSVTGSLCSSVRSRARPISGSGPTDTGHRWCLGSPLIFDLPGNSGFEGSLYATRSESANDNAPSETGAVQGGNSGSVERDPELRRPRLADGLDACRHEPVAVPEREETDRETGMQEKGTRRRLTPSSSLGEKGRWSRRTALWTATL